MARDDSAVLSARHLPALDGLRGLAFAAVFCFHFGEHRERSGVLRKALFRLSDLGGHGVEVFFVLSGFLITGILLDTSTRSDRFRRFYVRRSLRIFPLYCAFLLLIFVGLRPFVGGSAAYEALLGDQAWYWTYLQNWKIALSGWPAFAAVDHLWSLAVEEQFYMVWPILVFMTGRTAVIGMALVLIVASPLIRQLAMASGHLQFAGVSTFARTDSLALGALVAAALRSETGRVFVQRWMKPLALGAATVVVGNTLRTGAWSPFDRLSATWGLTAISVLAAAVIGIVAGEGRETGTTFLEARPLRALGTISYGGYVFHYPIMLALTPGLDARVGPGLWRDVIDFAVPALITLFASQLSFSLFEKPVMGLRRYFEQAPAPGATEQTRIS